MPSLTEEQKLAIESINKHTLVSAGAGSGKTFVLVERYIKVLESDPETKVSSIIAVTYTRKAAEEMRSRLKARLAEMAGSSPALESERWQMALAELEGARIGTIHSLCESILRNFPAEAEIDPAFEIMDDLERASHIQESLDAAMNQYLLADPELEADLLEFPLENLRDWLRSFLESPLKYKESRAKFGDLSKHSMESFARDLIENDCKEAIWAVLSDPVFLAEKNYLIDNPIQDPESKLGKVQDELVKYLSQFKKSLSLKETYQLFKSIAEMESARNAGGAQAKELRRCMRFIQVSAKSIVHKHHLDLKESDFRSFEVLSNLLNLADKCLEYYEHLKSKSQRLDFDDLIERCSQLCLKAPLALRQLSKDLKALLVDEYQDTNWTQARLLTSLCGAETKLFLIGDDKQSIYKFQGADVSVFNASKRYISATDDMGSTLSRAQLAESYGLSPLAGEGQVLSLSRSFRSQSQIVNLVNLIFSRLFSERDEESPLKANHKAHFQALYPAKENDDDKTVRIDFLYTAPLSKEETDDLKSSYIKNEAALVAQWISNLVSKSLPVFDKEQGITRAIKFSDFAVLLQANNDFADIEKALSNAGIPFVSIAGSGFLDKQEILDLESLLKWLDNPQDEHALFGALRSPMFAFSDGELHELKSTGGSSLFQAVLARASKLPVTSNNSAKIAAKILLELRQLAGKVSSACLLQKILELTAYDIVLLASQSGKQKSRNLYKFISLATKHRHLKPADFLAALRSMRDLGVKNLTDAPLSAGNAVKIMTIHKSKGLEFSAVALPKLERSAHKYTGKLLFSRESAIALDISRDAEEEKSSFFLAATNLNRRMEEEERKRLLYVALTRARDYLGLFLTARQSGSDNFGSWLCEALSLPHPKESFQNQIMHAGGRRFPSSWQLSQFDQSKQAEESGQSQSMPEERSEELLSKRLDGSRASIPANSPDLTLLQTREQQKELSYTPLKWQALLRACPNEKEKDLHQTILGNYFHLLMSRLGDDLSLPGESERKALLLHPELQIHDRQQQAAALKVSEQLLINFKNSALYPLMKNAQRRLHEFPYMITDEKGCSEFRPDLILQDQSGNWQIIDFKTDQVESKDISRQVKHHTGQLARYVDDFHAILGIRASAWIYFAQCGRLEKADLSAPVQLSLFGA